MDIRIVVDGAILQCTLGTELSVFKVPETNGITIQDKNAANIADHIAYKNIFPFCKCKRTIPPPPCTPVVGSKWNQGQQDCTFDKELALLKTSIVPCGYGGIIKVVESGQAE